MKDAYSFDRDIPGLNENYQKMLSAYQDIFKECGLEFIMVEADPGAMGGNLSHEFMVPGEIGEDVVEGKKMIEIGHIFQLGTKYSIAQQAFFLDAKGQRQPLIMGCYGIGVSRILAALAEVASDEKGLIWPKGVSPFDISLVVLDEKLLPEVLALEEDLKAEGLSVLIDERNEAAGVKFNDAYLIGNPYILIMGKKYQSEKTIDLEIRRTKKKREFKKEGLVNFLKDEYGR